MMNYSLCSGMKCDWLEMLSSRDLSSPTEGQSHDDDASDKGRRVQVVFSFVSICRLSWLCITWK